MNIDNGHITLWRDLTDEQKESGRWVKMGDGEMAVASSFEQSERRANLEKIFSPGSASVFRDDHPIYGKHRS